jgi:dTDP-4-amino-4,6-dideoxygalactose transaminase
VNAYNDAFEGNPYFDLPIEKNYAFSACHLYVIRLKDRLRDRKGEIFDMMTENGLGVQVHYMPVYLQPYYRDLGYEQDQCPQAEDFYRRVISIPIFPAMTDEEVAYVMDTVLRILEDADKG